MARHDLRAGAVGRDRGHRPRWRPESRGESVLRTDPTPDRVPHLVRGVDRRHPGTGDVVALEARSLAG